jgi:hypothetical protein
MHQFDMFEDLQSSITRDKQSSETRPSQFLLTWNTPSIMQASHVGTNSNK